MNNHETSNIFLFVTDDDCGTGAKLFYNEQDAWDAKAAWLGIDETDPEKIQAECERRQDEPGYVDTGFVEKFEIDMNKLQGNSPDEEPVPAGEYRCFIVATNSNGEPDLSLVRVQAPEEFGSSDAINAAAAYYAEEGGYEGCTIVTDTDPLFDCLKLPSWCPTWEQAELITLDGRVIKGSTLDNGKS